MALVAASPTLVALAAGRGAPDMRWAMTTPSSAVPPTMSTPMTTTATFSARSAPSPMPEPFHVTAPPEAVGERADRFLATAIGTLSRSRVKSLIEAGAILLGGVPLHDPARLVRPGDTFVVQPPPPLPAKPQPEAIPFAILHEDSDLIVLDKPAGLVVHPAPGNESGTLVNALLAHCGDDLPGIGGERRPGIVHRLDKDTSGVMVVAKTEFALDKLGAAFAARDLDRAYLALAWGLPAPAAGEIEGAVGRDPRDRKRMAVVARGGKAALTRYRTLRTWQGASLLECRLATGRTHQIRVHLAARGHPLVGDPVYLRRIPGAARLLLPGARAPLLDFPRQALHAASLGFRHPRTGTAMAFASPLPPDMTALLAALDVGTS
jgi:23S rRNA pseudouridine1911/1915/1917 synthase